MIRHLHVCVQLNVIVSLFSVQENNQNDYILFVFCINHSNYNALKQDDGCFINNGSVYTRMTILYNGLFGILARTVNLPMNHRRIFLIHYGDGPRNHHKVLGNVNDRFSGRVDINSEIISNPNEIFIEIRRVCVGIESKHEVSVNYEYI